MEIDTSASSDPKKGILYVVPTPLDFGCPSNLQQPIQDVLPTYTLFIASQLTHWITENAKSTRAFLKRVGNVSELRLPIQDIQLTELTRDIHKKGDHTPSQINDANQRAWLSPALSGHNIGLISEAGMPAIADPGSSVVRAAHKLGIHVEPLVGPISLMLALASSGLNGQNFSFSGYLPQDKPARTVRLLELEKLATKTGQTQIFIETPYRNNALLETAVSALQANTWLAVSSGLTLAQDHLAGRAGNTYSGPIHKWKTDHPHVDLSLPTVFMVGI